MIQKSSEIDPVFGISIHDDQMAEMEKEKAADAILKANGFITCQRGISKNGGSGVYTEDQLKEKVSKREKNPDPLYWLYTTAEIEMFELFQDDLRSICKMARFDEEECFIFMMYIFGLPQSEIARLINFSKQTVSVKISKLKRLFLTAMINNPFYGWMYVYLSEVHRG